MVLMCCPIINFQEELDALKARLEKVEKEKNEYKVAAEKFESRVRTKLYSLAQDGAVSAAL